MSIMKCNSIKPEYNRLLFRVKVTPGDRLFTRPSHGIYTRPIPEGYYMNRNAAKKPNPIVRFYKAIENLYQNSYLRALFESFRK